MSECLVSYKFTTWLARMQRLLPYVCDSYLMLPSLREGGDRFLGPWFRCRRFFNDDARNYGDDDGSSSVVMHYATPMMIIPL